MLASSGTTGLRTWEAALHLGEFLTIHGPRYVQGKRVLELGAGTGLLSILCCKYLHAVEVLATDGNLEIVEALEDNLFLNDLEDKQNNIRCRVLRWGRMLDDGEEGLTPDFDTVLGSDIVSTVARQLNCVGTTVNSLQTYDPTLLPLLVATFKILLERSPRITILIAATIRNDDTFSKFISTCSMFRTPCHALNSECKYTYHVTRSFRIPSDWRSDNSACWKPTNRTLLFFTKCNSHRRS